MSTNTPNMSLIQSTIGIDSGLNWEMNLNADLSILDSHNHTVGNGVQIPPSGLNINTALPFNNQQITGVQAVLFNNQASLATVNALYVIAGELWYNDPTNPVQITLGGAVNATSSGITGSGGATAAFSSGVLVVNSTTNTPGNIKAGSILIGQNVSSSNFLTLAPPASLSGGGWTLTLPAIPAAQQFMSIDASGNIAGYANVSGGLTHSNLSSSAGITGGQIASTTITATNIANNTITGTQIQNNVNLPGSPQMGGNNIVGASTNNTRPLVIIRGAYNGGIVAGEGFSVSNPTTGNYTITWTNSFFDIPVVVACMGNTTSSGAIFNEIACVNATTTSGCNITTGNGSSLFNGQFSFIAIGQR